MAAAEIVDLEQLAHELRTPLNGIKSWAHVLETLIDDPDPTLARAIDGILLGVEQQVALIDKLERWTGK
ncbi:MAG TPA: histidine kinase dimerization/phospho-acceptor domain-containing protein [Usitatibacter sp.]|nr:histidine kinase dimerization/phospho-acceptor domain-containing protein [Usitatibacter sp.]